MKTNVMEKLNNNIFMISITSIILISLMLRLLFFNGPFGSDEIVYLSRSLDVARGVWSTANYNGALRYGYNIPSGFLIYVFGLNMFTANLWPLLCSLTEIGVIFYFSWKYIGHAAALYSALFLAFMPLHVAISTRLHADPVVAMFLTLSFVFFFKAERESSKTLYFLTGIFLGCVFWVKELAAVTFFAFLIYPILIKNIKRDWCYLILGGFVMLCAHFMLMQFIAGDPFHALKVVIGQLNRNFISANQGEDSPWYYFYYLFFDIKHTWLAPVITLFSIIIYKDLLSISNNDAIKYCYFWLLSLLVVLSFFPVSMFPLRFAMKQSNYLSLFLAPISLIAGTIVSVIPRKATYLLIIFTLTGGFLLSGMEQQAYQVFTSNSRGLLKFSGNHSEHDIYGSVNNGRIACFYKILEGDACENIKIHDFAEIKLNVNHADDIIYTVVDRETQGWGDEDIAIDKLPSCWQKVERVVPAGTGNGHIMLSFFMNYFDFLPAKLQAKLNEITTPKHAYIYTANRSDIFCLLGK